MVEGSSPSFGVKRARTARATFAPADTGFNIFAPYFHMTVGFVEILTYPCSHVSYIVDIETSNLWYLLQNPL